MNGQLFYAAVESLFSGMKKRNVEPAPTGLATVIVPP
jgi:hypothetical protein